MYQGDLSTYRIHFDMTKPFGQEAQWNDASSASTDQTSLDPILITDHVHGPIGPDDRTIVAQLTGAGSVSASTENDGGTWIPYHALPPPTGPDHESLGAGPYAPGMAATPAYPHAVYYCSQAEVLSPQPGPTAFCSRSDDGG